MRVKLCGSLSNFMTATIKPYKVHYCNNCGAMFSETFTWLTYYNYCPQCGSHMRRSDWDEVEKAKLTRKTI